MKTSTYTYRFFSIMFITAVACKVSKTETLVYVEAAEGSLCIAEVEGKTACSKSNDGSLSICWSKFVKNPGIKFDWTDILPLWMEAVEKGCVSSEGISIDDPLMVVVNEWFTPNWKEWGCTVVVSPDKLAIGWLNVDWIVVLSVACDNVWEADDCFDWECKVGVIKVVTGSFDRDVMLCKVEALNGLLQEVWVAEDDVKLVFRNFELKSDRFERAGKVIQDWSAGIRVAVLCNVKICDGLKRDSPRVSVETVLIESLNKFEVTSESNSSSNKSSGCRPYSCSKNINCS